MLEPNEPIYSFISIRTRERERERKSGLELAIYLVSIRIYLHNDSRHTQSNQSLDSDFEETQR